MGKTIAQKIIAEHCVVGVPTPGSEIGVRIDQTLTQDATGTMAYLQFEAMHLVRIKTDLSVSYIDHNTVQIGFENADDHRYLHGIAKKYGIYLSRAGNGICHQVHLERFGKPGATLIGADSHTPTAGALAMLAMGAGGLDVALAMAGEPFFFDYPRITKINLTGSLPPWVSAKDIVLKVLQLFSTKGNVGSVFEYGGPGTALLSVPERATIANMGAECGVTTSIFPSDAMTRRFLIAENRERDWRELSADPDAVYERVVEINLSELEPLTARPHSPDNIGTVREMGEIAVQQVCLGSCTNSSYKDLATVARILKDRVVHPDVSFIIAPGSRQVMENISRDGYLTDLLAAGARIMENACGFCIGNSQSPATKAVSLRTSNRNFLGRSGTKDADIYLVSPETAAAAVITGKFTDPRDLAIPYPAITVPAQFSVDDRMIIPPDAVPDSTVTIERGPNIGNPPESTPLPEAIAGEVAIKVEDKITTDHIIPAGDLMKYRSNIPKYAEFVFAPLDKDFSQRAKRIQAAGNHAIIVAGLSYGQGSSREHAAICPMYLGVRVVIAKSFERIHAANLINFGILPLIFQDEREYEHLMQGDRLLIDNIRKTLQEKGTIVVNNLSRNRSFEVSCDFSERQKTMLLAGGALNVR